MRQYIGSNYANAGNGYTNIPNWAGVRMEAAIRAQTQAEIAAIRAQALVVRNGGRSRVSITTNGRVNLDLTGRPHNGVRTPHVQWYQNNIITRGPRVGQRGSRSPIGETTEATVQEMRIIRNYLRSMGQ